MSTTAHCKFNVRCVADHGNDTRVVTLIAVTDSRVATDQAFTKGTPSGDATITIQNPALFGLFVPGKQVNMFLTAVED